MSTPLLATTALLHSTTDITFWINAHKANTAGKVPVSMRLTIAGKRAEVSTGIRCLPQEWSKAKKRLVSVKWDEEAQAYQPTKLSNATRQLNTLLDDLEARTRLLASDMRQHVTPGRPVTARGLRAKLLCPNPEAAPEPCVLLLLEEAGGSYANASTRATARTAVNALRKFVAPAAALLLSDLTPALCDRFGAWVTEQASASAAHSYLAVLRALMSRALPDLKNPFGKGGHKPTAAKPRYVLSRAEFAALEVAELPTEAARLARDIYVAQYYLHGSRIGAVLTLPWAQVDWGNGRVRFKAEKGGEWHSVVLRPQLAVVLRRYYSPGATGFVFPALPNRYAGQTLDRRYLLRKAATTKVWRGLQAVAELLNLPGKLHSHTARHTLATHTVQATGDFRAAQSLLGHQSLAMTEKYVRSMLPEEKDAAADAVYGTGGPIVTPTPAGGRVIPLWDRAA